MSELYFLGDTHFNHKNIIKFEAELRPFETIEEHNETIVERWNKIVKKDDTVWHLGDLLFGKATINHEILDRLAGRKKLVMGNHDDFSNQYLYKEIFPRFERICGVGQVHGFVLTHIPIADFSLGRWKGNIHGHTHSHSINDKRYINVSCEQVGLTPISYDDVLKRWENANNTI